MPEQHITRCEEVAFGGGAGAFRNHLGAAT
jgi:hypothetical protein